MKRKTVNGDATDTNLVEMDRNPNEHPNLNDSPCGPTSHLMGHTGDGGLSDGSETVKGRGGSFHFK